jgi:hypothetical protein
MAFSSLALNDSSARLISDDLLECIPRWALHYPRGGNWINPFLNAMVILTGTITFDYKLVAVVPKFCVVIKLILL